MREIAQIIKAEVRFLFFLPTKLDLSQRGKAYLFFSITLTWLAGISRYLHNPYAPLWQKVGIGSMLYLFVLALLLWLILWPLRPKQWQYRTVIIGVGMTSPPAFLHAIPFESFYGLETVQALNIWLLVFIVLWRVFLLSLYVGRIIELDGCSSIISVLLPIPLIIIIVTALNLDYAIFDLKGVLIEESINDLLYESLLVISLFSLILLPVLLLAYGWIIWTINR